MRRTSILLFAAIGVALLAPVAAWERRRHLNISRHPCRSAAKR